MTDHRNRPDRHVPEVDVAVASSRRPVLAAHVLREDSPRLDAAHDVNAHVTLRRSGDVVRMERRGDADRGRLVALSRVEAARDLALLVEDVPALLDPAGEEHVAEHPQEVGAVEPGLSDLVQRADRGCFPDDCHRFQLYPTVCTLNTWGRQPTPFARNGRRRSATGSRSASRAATHSATSSPPSGSFQWRVPPAAASSEAAAPPARRSSTPSSPSSAKAAAALSGTPSSSAPRSEKPAGSGFSGEPRLAPNGS